MNYSINGLGDVGLLTRNKQANEEIRRETTQKILDAATAVFAAKGRAATMADIAAKAQVSQGLGIPLLRKQRRNLFHPPKAGLGKSRRWTSPTHRSNPRNPGSAPHAPNHKHAGSQPPKPRNSPNNV